MAALDGIIGYGVGASRPAAGVPGRLYYASDTDAFSRDNGATWDTLAPGGGGGGALAYILIRDEKTSATEGGTFTTGSWQKRDLNVEVEDTGGIASIATSQITLAAGTYRCQFSAPAFYVSAHQTRLRDITNGTTLVLGTSEYAALSTNVVSRSHGAGRFTLAGSTVLELQHQCAATKTTNGLGVAGSFGTEVYAVIEFWAE